MNTPVNGTNGAQRTARPTSALAGALLQSSVTSLPTAEFFNCG
jgi:hypothetical protein